MSLDNLTVWELVGRSLRIVATSLRRSVVGKLENLGSNWREVVAENTHFGPEAARWLNAPPEDWDFFVVIKIVFEGFHAFFSDGALNGKNHQIRVLKRARNEWAHSLRETEPLLEDAAAFVSAAEEVLRAIELDRLHEILQIRAEIERRRGQGAPPHAAPMRVPTQPPPTVLEVTAGAATTWDQDALIEVLAELGFAYNCIAEGVAFGEKLIPDERSRTGYRMSGARGWFNPTPDGRSARLQIRSPSLDPNCGTPMNPRPGAVLKPDSPIELRFAGVFAGLPHWKTEGQNVPPELQEAFHALLNDCFGRER